MSAPPFWRATKSKTNAGWALGPTIGTALFEYVGGAVWVMCAALGVLAYLAMRAGVREPVLP